MSVAVVEGTKKPLRIVHVLRAPVGGLFRHVIDLARGQSGRGHQVGLIADSATGGPRADDILREFAASLALGAIRIPMPRHLGFDDIAAVRAVSRQIARAAPDVVHGHGAKGAAYARLAHANKGTVRAYTPHGGSLHYGASPTGFFYLTLERLLMRRTDLLLFESEFGRDAYRAKVGLSDALVRVVHNGIAESEFKPVAPATDATNLVFVGELRMLKGVDVLIDALIALARKGRAVSLTIVGDGPDRTALQQQAKPLAELARFVGVLPARQGFTMGRMLVVPSRAESLPYIVLEAAGAGMPVIATRVGGVPEIFGPQASQLVLPGDPAALSRAIVNALDDREQTARTAQMLHQRVRSDFSVEEMVAQGLQAYRQALTARGVLSPGVA